MISARVRSTAPIAVIALLAFAVREALVLRGGGGPHATYGYDTSVYYAAADGFIHGRIPYRDFVLLHPPMVMLALTPAALLGHLTSDSTGFAAANLAFIGLGAINAVLVTVTALRWGISRGAAVLGGLFYATWLGSVEAEFTCRLEPLGNAGLLAGLLLVAPPGDGARPSGRRLAFAGIALGLAVSTKIWFIAPAVAVGIWTVRYGRAGALRYAAGFALAVAVVDLPFLILSRGVMFSRVVLDQLGRRVIGAPRARWSSIATVSRLPGAGSSALLLVLATAVLMAVVVFALRNHAARFFALLVILHGAVLLASPSWFGFYADYLAAPLALAVAAAAGRLGPAWRGLPAGRAVAALAVLGATAGAASVVVAGTKVAIPWRSAAKLQALVRHDRCVVSDSPAGLIELNRLDVGFARGCPDWVDVTGMTYFGPDHVTGSRRRDVHWQRDLVRYLRHGDAAFVVRPVGDGLSIGAKERLARGTLVVRVGGTTLYQRSAAGAKPAG